MSEEMRESNELRFENQAPTRPRVKINHIIAIIFITIVSVQNSFLIRYKCFSWIKYPWKNHGFPICTLMFFTLKLISYKIRPQNPKPHSDSEDFLFVLSALFLVISMYLTTKPTMDYRLIIDIFIGLGTRPLVFLSQYKMYIWLCMGTLLWAGLVIARNRFDDIMKAASNHRFLQTFVPAGSSSSTRDIEEGITESNGSQMARGGQGLREPLLRGGATSEIQPRRGEDE